MPRIQRLLQLLLLIAVVLPGVALLLPGVALASVTTGAIKGVTVDEGSLPIPGVVVTVTSDNLMGSRQSTTDANGRFLLPELPPGKYDLVAEKAGFAKISMPKLQVIIGRNVILTIEMPLRESGEEMIIEERRPTIDTESASRGSVLTKEFLDRIPAGRSYQQAIQMAAGVTGGANANIGGAGYNENTYMLDGVNITDPVTGTFSLNFNFDAIEQIEVLTGAFDPEYGYNLGGAINVVTASGGNTLETNTGLYYSNGNWAPKQDARYAADGAQLAPTDFDSRFEIIRAGSTISGPIVRDKVWYLASYQYTRSLIANAGIDLPRDFDAQYIFTKVTMQPTASHRFTLIGQTDPTTIDNLDQSDRFVKPEAQYRQAQGGYLMSGQWDWFISPEMFLETKTLLQKSYIEQYAVPCTHDKNLGYHPCENTELENNIDFVTPARYGINNAFDRDNAGFFYFDDRWRASIDTKFSVLQSELLGTHDTKIGVSLDTTSWSQSVGYSGNVQFVDLNDVAYDPDTLKNYYWLETTGPFTAQYRAGHFGAFVQDVYKPIDNLTFRYGMRYDRSILNNDVGEQILNVGLWGPRFSVIWDPWANGKTKIVGSAGRFNDAGRLSVASYLAQSGTGSKLVVGEYFGNFESTASGDYFYTPLENTNVLGDDVISPHSDEFSIGGEREIIQDLAAQLYFTGKFTRNLWAFDDLNLVWDEDGNNVLGSRDGTLENQYRLRSPNIARRNYFRMDTGLKRNFADRWEVQANYSMTHSRGTVQTSPSGVLAVSPQVKYYLDGLLYSDVRHDIASGFAWDIPNDPWTTQVGGVFFLETGNPSSRYYGNASFAGNGSFLKQTAGTYARRETWWTLNLKVDQALPVRKGKLHGVFEVHNVFNNRQGQYAGVSGDNRWIISNRQDPIELMIGAKYEF
jgi:hypothetical protein